jgi:hypothetical protein
VKTSLFVRSSLRKLWDGFLRNTGVIISAFIFTGGYLVVLNKLRIVQSWVRGIPTDYILTPAVILVVLVVVLLRINWKQRRSMIPAEASTSSDSDKGEFVTHFGVYWKVCRDSEYIEDFPYCVCCEPHKKLVQTNWHPDETFKCSKTNVEYKLYSEIPQKLRDVLGGLYRSYFRGFGGKLTDYYKGEMHRLMLLNPETEPIKLTRLLFEMEPLCRIPKDEVEAILAKMPHPLAAFQFVEIHLQKYKQYMKTKH